MCFIALRNKNKTFTALSTDHEKIWLAMMVKHFVVLKYNFNFNYN